MTVLNELVDLDSYPIEDTASPQGRALLEQGRRSLQDTAVFALARMQAEARGLAPFGHHREGHRDSIGNDDRFCALGEKFFCQCKPDAACGAGDDGCLVSNFHVRGSVWMEES